MQRYNRKREGKLGQIRTKKQEENDDEKNIVKEGTNET